MQWIKYKNMDKRLCGKWISTGFNNMPIFLKIELDGEIIGIDDFREILIAGETVTPNEDFTCWGKDEGRETFITGSYRDYMAKNLIRIDRNISHSYGNDSSNESVILIPKKYMENEAQNFSEWWQQKFITSKEEFWQV